MAVYKRTGEYTGNNIRNIVKERHKRNRHCRSILLISPQNQCKTRHSTAKLGQCLAKPKYNIIFTNRDSLVHSSTICLPNRCIGYCPILPLINIRLRTAAYILWIHPNQTVPPFHIPADFSVSPYGCAFSNGQF